MQDNIQAVLDEYQKWLNAGAIPILPLGSEPIDSDSPWIGRWADVRPDTIKCECGHELNAVRQMQGYKSKFPVAVNTTVEFFVCERCSQRYVLKLETHSVANV